MRASPVVVCDKTQFYLTRSVVGDKRASYRQAGHQKIACAEQDKDGYDHQVCGVKRNNYPTIELVCTRVRAR